jgi:hypothetical protein
MYIFDAQTNFMKKLYTLLFIVVVAGIGNAQSAYISYPSAICTTSPNVAVVLTGTGNYLGGTFSSSTVGLMINPVTGEITPSASAAGTYVVTYSVPASPPDWIAISVTRIVTIVPMAIPSFITMAPVCYGSTAPLLPSLSNNGISGTWSPPTVNTTATTTYIFTPNSGQCATPTTLTVEVNPVANPTIYTVNGSNTVYVDSVTDAVTAGLSLSCGITSSDYTYEWYEDGVLIATSDTFTVNTASVNGSSRVYNVRVTTVATGCSVLSAGFLVLQSTGVPPPPAPRYQSLPAGSTLADVVVSGTGVRWYASAFNKNATTTELPLNTLLTDNTTYYASQTVNGNESLERQPVTVTLTLGIGASDLTSVVYWPNPVKDILNIKSANLVDSVSISNMLGQALKTARYNQSEILIDINSFKTGTYFVRVKSADRTTVFKIVKE